MIVPCLPHLIIRAPHEREPDVYCARRKHLRWHHSDNGVGLVSKIHSPSQNLGITRKRAVPQSIADHREKWPAHSIFFRGEDAAELGLEPNDLEKGGRHKRSADLFRRASLEAAQVVRFAS